METKDKMKLTLKIITLTAISLFSVAFYQRRRKQKNPPQICYLDTELNKPQSSFKRVLADNSYNPFKHLNRNRDNVLNVHPYEKEITELIGSNGVEFSRFFYGGADLDMEMKESYVWVDSEEELVKLVDVLSEERLFAVDIEHHSLRSFLGFTALLQISTQKEDYLVDTIALHDVMCLLRPVFSDPNICKVFHGADNDVTWLQRDFHIYIVNLFDTAKACEVLSKSHRSLAYLLETYCGVATNKMLQREDWRLRPLSEEMIQYARTDAHYLLYIASCMANELKKQTTENIVDLDDEFPLVREANRRSNMICLQLYTKEIEASPGESVAQSILSRNFTGQGGVSSNSEAKELVGRLCMWRDLMARVHDESLRYVLSDQAIVAVASKVPTTAIEIYDTISEADLDVEFLCGGSSVPSPSPVVCSHLEDICDLLAGKISNLGNVFQTLPQKHLGPSGCCPLSIYNYALLTKSNLRVTNGFSAKQNGIKSYKQFGRKASRSRQLFVKKFSCKSPVYHNCRIYASDGRLLCYCDRRKLDWYLSRDLAKLVENDPPGIMLLFEPKGRPEDEDNDFYIQSKKNICVGCGERNHYLRYRIVPSCYRMHFPEHLKSHRSHDIVLLCVDCHEVAHSVAEKHKRQIAAEFGIPLFVKKVTESSQTDIIDGTSGSEENVEEVGVSPLQLRAAAMALLRHGPNMPAKRREELTLTVMKYFGGRKISTDDLKSALLVGMSPHQRRKHEKKRGLPFKHSTRGHLSNEANYNNADSIRPYTLTEAIKWDYKNGLETATEANLGVDMDASTRDIHKGCDSKVKGDAATTDGEDLNFNIASLLNKGKATDTGEDLEDKSLSDFTYNSSQCKPSGTVSSTYNQKMSLLGHGPHGKQVVDHLLKKYGEDGIRLFCQRWRQVFVEALHPRFLPSGWDVNHRGRRDFGEYSVYNPIKKSTIKATD